MTAETPVVIEISVDDPELRQRLRHALSKLDDIRLAEDGERADAVVSAVRAFEPEPTLTPREVEVLMLLAEGASNPEIAARLGISSHTAKFHVSRVIEKLDATGRTDAVAQAARIGVLNL